jgi:hypothetical protein
MYYLHARAVESVVQTFAPASRSDIGLAAVAWADPPLVRIFYIGEDNYPSQLVYQNGSWLSNPNPVLPQVLAVTPGEPISAVQRGSNSGEAYAEAFFASGLAIANVAKFPDAGWFVGDFGAYNVTSPLEADAGLSTSDKIALGCGIGIGVPAIIASILAAWRFRK